MDIGALAQVSHSFWAGLPALHPHEHKKWISGIVEGIARVMCCNLSSYKCTAVQERFGRTKAFTEEGVTLISAAALVPASLSPLAPHLAFPHFPHPHFYPCQEHHADHLRCGKHAREPVPCTVPGHAAVPAGPGDGFGTARPLSGAKGAAAGWQGGGGSLRGGVEAARGKSRPS